MSGFVCRVDPDGQVVVGTVAYCMTCEALVFARLPSLPSPRAVSTVDAGEDRRGS